MSRQTDTDGLAAEAVDGILARYGDVAGDEAAFAASLAEPLPPCVWANPLRVAPQGLAGLLEDEGIEAGPVGWQPGAFRLGAGTRPGLSWLYRAGLMQIQEEAAMLSVRLLDPRPGDRVLDLCAAPGNKTARIAMALDNRGTVVANDLKVGRLAPLHAAIARLGLINVTTTARDGTAYPLAAGRFDRVLVDAPCSGEGTARKGYGQHRPVPDDFRQWLTGIQRALLRRAVALCRPGGRIVYSTCTFAPDENEGVVDQVLGEHADGLRVIATAVAGLETSPGLIRWRGRRYSPALAGAVRLWPHLADTGGFFAVALERTGTPDGPTASGEPAADEGDRAILEEFTDYYGLPDGTFDGLRVVRTGHRLRLAAADHTPPERPPAVATGLSLTRDRSVHPKIATPAALAFGRRARRNVIELTRNEVDRYLDREDMSITSDRLAACDGTGQVIVRHRGFALGVALLRRSSSGPFLESLFPRSWG